MKVLATLGLLLALAVAPSLAHAQGTHFFAEADIGTSLPLGATLSDTGYTVGLTGGFGGKLPGMLFRGYVLGELNYSTFAIERCGIPDLQRELVDMAVGGRVLLPLFESLRIYGDVLLSGIWIDSQEFDADGNEVWLSDSDPRLAITTAIGVQFRPFEFFSVGARGDFLFLVDDSDLPEEEIEGRFGIVGTVALHF